MQRFSTWLMTVTVPVVALWLALGSTGSVSAQFGGFQEMTLDKIRRRQAADARQLGRGGPIQGGPVQQPSVTKNYFISPYPYYPYYPSYGYDPYGYDRYGWGTPYSPTYGYPGWPPTGYYSAPPATVFIQPQLPPVIREPPAARADLPPLQRQNPAAAAGRAPAAAAEEEILRRVSVLKPSNEAGRMRADNLIADGDREFADQEYRRAAAKYREAIGRAPDYAPGHLRAGHAYTATGDYELAVTYFAMGFELARTIDRGGFSLEALYRGNRLAKEEHLESLAEAILRQPEEGGLLFLTGLALHYDGKPLQGRDYFRRAAEMPGRHRPYASMFLPAAPGPAADDAAAVAAPAERRGENP